MRQKRRRAMSAAAVLAAAVVLCPGCDRDSSDKPATGEVWAWGDNWKGQLGDGTEAYSLTPVQVVGPDGIGYLTGVTDADAGAFQTFACRDDGTVWAWGWNDYGQLGDGTLASSDRPLQVVGPGGEGYLTGATAVAAGGWHTVAVKSGTVWAWGDNSHGQLGDGTETDSPTPVQVVGPGGLGFLGGVAAIVAGNWHTVALKADGTVWAWGANWACQLGDGTDIYSPTPVQVVDPGGVGYLTGVTAISAGVWHTVALKADGTVWAWGENVYGQLGDGGTTRSSTPVQVVGPGGSGFLTGVTAIDAGGTHTVALKDDGTVWAWGFNDDGELGDGTQTDSATPVQVVGPGGSGYLTGVTAVAAGIDHTGA
ncbi:MAG: RCC1 domain-containing protein, partial [Planctomycetota bacterium]